VIETVGALRFSIDWNVKSSQRGGKAWKTKYLKELCWVARGEEMERINTYFMGKAREKRLASIFKTFKGKYEKLVTARNQIRKLYLAVSAFYCQDGHFDRSFDRWDQPSSSIPLGEPSKGKKRSVDPRHSAEPWTSSSAASLVCSLRKPRS
jgi:hypothetical protein